MNHGDGDGDADAFSLLVRLKCRLRSNCRTPTAGELHRRSNSLESQRRASTGGMTPGFYNLGSVIETFTLRCTSCTRARPSG